MHPFPRQKWGMPFPASLSHYTPAIRCSRLFVILFRQMYQVLHSFSGKENSRVMCLVFCVYIFNPYKLYNDVMLAIKGLCTHVKHARRTPSGPR